jgi:hypothetical protein
MVALAVGLSACGSSGVAHTDAPAPEGADLGITLERVPSGWMVHTTRPASVALVEIVPNRGAGLLFPDPLTGEGRLEAGTTRIVTKMGRVIGRHREAYLNEAGTVGMWGRDRRAIEDLYASNAPPTVVAIACECALRLDALASPSGPSELLGPFASISAGSATQRLVAAVLPAQDVVYGLTFVLDPYKAGAR